MNNMHQIQWLSVIKLKLFYKERLARETLGTLHQPTVVNKIKDKRKKNNTTEVTDQVLPFFRN